MTDNELVLVISDMMDKKLDTKLSPIGNQINGLENQMNRFENRMDGLENKVDGLENRMDGLESKVNGLENQLHRIEVDLLENNVLPRLCTIESCYTDTYNRYKDYADKMEMVFDDTELLKKVVAEHSEKLQRIV